MAKYRPDIKPPMWGPPDAVQYAVRVNAERMGLDPLFVSPLWEGGGLALDYANGLSGQLTAVSVGVPAWKSGGVDFGWVSSTAYGYVDFQQDFTLPADFTVAFDYIAGTYRTYQGLITSGGFGHGWSIYQYTAGAYETWRVILPGKTLTFNLPTTGSGTCATIVVTQKSGSVRMYKNGVESITGTTAGITTSSVGDSPLRLGCRSATNDAPEYGADCVILSALIADGVLAPDEYHATPYSLLMPVSRPVYFDLGATGNTDSSADPGNIAISGSAATGVKASISSADSGTVAIAGSVASGIRSLVSLATAASIAIAGFSAEGVYTPTGSTVSSAGPGAVAISGSPANGVQTHISSADPGTVVILGSDANAATGYATTAEPGTVAITGADATASRTYVATAGPTSIAISGSPAFATKSGGSSTSSGISLIFGKVILHL